MPVQYEPWSIQNEEQDLWGVAITEGTFSGTIIAFNDISLMDNENGAQLDYTIYKIPEGLDSNKVSEIPEFNDCLQFIVEDILKKAIDNYENRESNTTKSDS
jgi:hypothetical protein